MKAKILIVDDDLTSIRIMAHALKDLGEIRFAADGRDALRLARSWVPTVIVLDSEMPGMGGFEACGLLKDEPVTADIPIIFVTSHSGIDFEVTGFDLGAADFIGKPISPSVLSARVRTQIRLAQVTHELREIASTDALTRVANRGRFDETLQTEWARARRYVAPISLMMVDVDHFKRYNDYYGHPAGDECLVRVASVLRSVCGRPGDLVARYGGEEFALLMPQTDREGARHMAERAMGAITSMAIPHADSPTAPHVSISAGVSFFDENSDGWQLVATDFRHGGVTGAALSAASLVGSADTALYSAKRLGRSRFELSDVGTSRPEVLEFRPSGSR